MIKALKNPLIVFGIIPILLNFATGNFLLFILCLGPINLLLLTTQCIKIRKIKLNIRQIDILDIVIIYSIYSIFILIYFFFENFEYRLELSCLLILTLFMLEIKYLKRNVLNTSALFIDHVNDYRDYYNDFFKNIIDGNMNCNEKIYLNLTTGTIYLKVNENVKIYKDETLINGNKYKTNSVIRALKALNISLDNCEECQNALLEMYLI